MIGLWEKVETKTFREERKIGNKTSEKQSSIDCGADWGLGLTNRKDATLGIKSLRHMIVYKENSEWLENINN